MPTTTHQYLEKYPFKSDSEKLILGTIHPHDHERFVIPFFYGNRASIWEILSEAFPNELPQPLTLKEILTFLDNRKIAISDVVATCDRTQNSALDVHLINIVLNPHLKQQIAGSQVTEIFFTSGFGKNNAFRLFYEQILELPITAVIKNKKDALLPEVVFGREIKLTILFSPSGAANVGISKSKLYLDVKEKYADFATPVARFKVDYYRDKFS